MTQPGAPAQAAFDRCKNMIAALKADLDNAKNQITLNEETSRASADQWNTDVYMKSVFRRACCLPRTLNFNEEEKQTFRNARAVVWNAAVGGLFGAVGYIAYTVYYSASIADEGAAPANYSWFQDLTSAAATNAASLIGYGLIPATTAAVGAVYQTVQNYYSNGDGIKSHIQRLEDDRTAVREARNKLRSAQNDLSMLKSQRATISTLATIQANFKTLNASVGNLKTEVSAVKGFLVDEIGTLEVELEAAGSELKKVEQGMASVRVQNQRILFGVRDAVMDMPERSAPHTTELLIDSSLDELSDDDQDATIERLTNVLIEDINEIEVLTEQMYARAINDSKKAYAAITEVQSEKKS